MDRMFRSSGLVALALLVAVTTAGAVSAQTLNYFTFYDEVGAGLQTNVCRLSLSDGQHGGVTVSFTSPDTNLVRVTADPDVPGSEAANVFVPNGGTVVEFYVQALEDTTGTVDITASAPGFADAVRAVDVVAPSVHLSGLGTTIDPFDLEDAFLVSVGLSNTSNTGISVSQKVRVGGPGLTATLTSDNAAAAELVTTALTGQVVSVAIAPGEPNSPSGVAGGGVALNGLAAGTVVIGASIPGFVPTTGIPKTVTVTPAEITWSSLPANVGSGLQIQSRLVVLSGSQHGGVAVQVAVGDSNAILVAPNATTAGTGTYDFFIPNGQRSASFAVQALEGVVGDQVLTAAAPGFASGFTTVSVVQPFFRLSGLGTAIDTLDPDDAFLVTVGLPNGSFTGISQSQNARQGGPGITATVTNSDGAVGQLKTSTTTGNTAVVFIAPGSSGSPSSVAAGGVAFDGVGVGMTQVTGTVPGFAPVSTALVDVTVSQPSISLSNFSTTVAAGLVSSQNFISLGASQHGGVTVQVASLDPALALVSAHPDSVGTPAVDLFIADGGTSITFWTHALEDTTGTVTIEASSPLFVTGANTLNVVRPAVKLNSLGTTIDTIDADDAFFVSIGFPNFNFTNLTAQKVRPGSAGFDVDITLDDPVIGRFVTLPDTGSAVTLNIPAGDSNTPTSVANGGVAFDGLSAGVVQVAVSSARADQITLSTKDVTVTAPTISVSNTTKVGAGLQTQATANLSASGHGGVNVTITSVDPSLMLVAAGNLDAGQPAIDLFVANGAASASFWIQGVDGMTGTADFVVSSPQFVTEPDSIEVVQPGIEITGLGASLDVSDVPDAFYARVGVPLSNNSAVAGGARQQRRGGEPPLEVTLISVNGAVAEIADASSSNDTITVQIVAGSSQSPTTIGGGGAGLVGLTAGQTVVTAAIGGFIQTGAGQQVVDVTNQNIFLNGLTTRLGAGLQSAAVSAELGESSHGGVTVHVASPDSSLVLLSTNALAAGTGSVDIFLPNGQTEAVFYLQALEAAAGNTVSVIASAPTFAAGAQNVDIVAPATAITLLADSMDVNVDDDEFVVQIGAISADGTGLFETQPIRGGGAVRTLTVFSDMEALALIETSTTSDDTATVNLDPGEFQTASTVAAGGVAFNPVLGGQVMVTASIPGFITTPAGMPTITLTGEVTGVGDVVRPVYRLGQNFPNPFNPRTKIAFSLAAAGPVTLKIFDLGGRLVRTLHAGEVLAPGPHQAVWSGQDDRGATVAAGVYFYRLETPSFQAVKRMTLLK